MNSSIQSGRRLQRIQRKQFSNGNLFQKKTHLMCSKTFGLIQLYLKGRLEIFVYDVENFLLFLSTTATFQH